MAGPLQWSGFCSSARQVNCSRPGIYLFRCSQDSNGNLEDVLRDPYRPENWRAAWSVM
jgi:hypothetical protein